MVTQGLARDGDPLFDHHGGFDRRQGVSRDGVRRLGQLKILRMVEVRHAKAQVALEPVKLGLFRRNACKQVIHKGIDIF